MKQFFFTIIFCLVNWIGQTMYLEALNLFFFTVCPCRQMSHRDVFQLITSYSKKYKFLHCNDFFAKIICRVFYNANTIIKETIFKRKKKKCRLADGVRVAGLPYQGQKKFFTFFFSSKFHGMARKLIFLGHPPKKVIFFGTPPKKIIFFWDTPQK